MAHEEQLLHGWGKQIPSYKLAIIPTLILYSAQLIKMLPLIHYLARKTEQLY